MKKLAYCALVALFAACAPSFEDRVGDAVKATLPNADSYEFISQEEVMRLTYGEQLQQSIDKFARQDAMNKAMGFQRKDSVMVARLKDLQQRKADSLDVIAATLFKHTFRYKDVASEPVDTTFYVWVEDTLGNVVSVSAYEYDPRDTPRPFSEYGTIFQEVLMTK